MSHSGPGWSWQPTAPVPVPVPDRAGKLRLTLTLVFGIPSIVLFVIVMASAVTWSEATSDVVTVALLLAFVPAIVYSLFFWFLDLYEKEPLRLLLLCFVWGAIPAVLIAVFGSEIITAVLAAGLTDAATDAVAIVIVAPVVEEIAKGVVVIGLVLLCRREFDSPLDGVVFGAIVGLGFAAVEDFLYMLQGFSEGGFTEVYFVAFGRVVLTGFGHALFTSLTGLGASYIRHARTRRMRVLAPLLGLAAAMVLHALFNATAVFGLVVLTLMLHWLALFAVLGMIGYFLARERKWMRSELREEVGYGVISTGEVVVCCSAIRRGAGATAVLFRGGPKAAVLYDRFYRIMSELALLKYNMRSFGDDDHGHVETQQLRAKLAQMRPRVESL